MTKLNADDHHVVGLSLGSFSLVPLTFPYLVLFTFLYLGKYVKIVQIVIILLQFYALRVFCARPEMSKDLSTNEPKVWHTSFFIHCSKFGKCG